MSVAVLFLAVCLGAWSGPAPVAQQPDEAPAGYDVQYPPGPVLLGTWFDLVVLGPDIQNLRVDVSEHLGDVLSEKTVRSERGVEVEMRRRMCFARQGEYSLPMYVVDASGQTTALPPLELSVVLDKPVGHINMVADLRGPVSIPTPPGPFWEFLLAICLGLVALMAYVIGVGRSRPVFEYQSPPDQIAIAALERLRLHLPRTREETRPFVIDVSDVLRTYLESVFEIHAPALTTEEFLAETSARDDALGDRREVLESFLSRCDLVKYAGERPLAASAEPLLDTVESFVEETRREEPAASEGHVIEVSPGVGGAA
jgi:hypothetical protein